MKNIFLKNTKIKLLISGAIFLVVALFYPLYFCYYPPCKAWQEVCMPTRICTKMPLYKEIQAAGFSFDLIRVLIFAGIIFLILYTIISFIIYFAVDKKKKNNLGD